MTNYYLVLGVLRSVSQAEIKSAHRHRCRQSHPDAGGSGEEFANITAAYRVLGDVVKRRDWEASYIASAERLGHFVCLSGCFSVNRVRALKPGQFAECAHCRERLEVSSAERNQRYQEALRDQVGDLVLTIGAETGQLAHDAIIVAVNAIRRKFKLGRQG